MRREAVAILAALGIAAMLASCGDDTSSLTGDADASTTAGSVTNSTGSTSNTGSGSDDVSSSSADTGSTDDTGAATTGDSANSGDPECGNGTIEPGETCDDMNAIDGDGCDADCQPSAVTAVVAGNDQTCALLGTGSVRCWGRNDLGFLGYQHTDNIGDDEDPADAGDVDLGEPALSIASSSHSCATLGDGRLRCWGKNSEGMLGYGNTDPVGDDEPPSAAGDVDVGGMVDRVGLSLTHTCVVLDTGAVRCWGSGTTGLGYGTPFEDLGDDEVPADVGDVELGATAVDIVAGTLHTCALLGGGDVKCWGDGSGGVLGYGDEASVESPSEVGPVPIGGPVVQLASGWAHTCALLEGGSVRCWGSGEVSGNLGYGTQENIGDDETPEDVGDIDVGAPVEAITTGRYHTCALLAGGCVRCWGEGGITGYGNLETIGDDETPATAGEVDIGGPVTQISAGATHTCARLETGTVRCWGTSYYGELGYASTESISDDEVPADAGDVKLF